jgi:hypothetical protein
MRCPRAYRAKLPASAFAVLRFVASSKTVGVFPGRSPALGTLQNSVEIVRTLCHAPSGSLRIGSSLVASLRLAPAARSAFRFAFNLERSRNGVARAGLHLARSLFARYAHSFPPCSEPEAERFPRCSAPRSRSDLAHTRVDSPIDRRDFTRIFPIHFPTQGRSGTLRCWGRSTSMATFVGIESI